VCLGFRHERGERRVEGLDGLDVVVLQVQRFRATCGEMHHLRSHIRQSRPHKTVNAYIRQSGFDGLDEVPCHHLRQG